MPRSDGPLGATVHSFFGQVGATSFPTFAIETPSIFGWRATCAFAGSIQPAKQAFDKLRGVLPTAIVDMLKVQFGAGNLQLDLINEVLEPWVQIVLPEPPYRHRSREREPQQPDAVVEDDQAPEHAWKAERQRDHGRKIQEGHYPESSPREPQGREHRSIATTATISTSASTCVSVPTAVSLTSRRRLLGYGPTPEAFLYDCLAPLDLSPSSTSAFDELVQQAAEQKKARTARAAEASQRPPMTVPEAGLSHQEDGVCCWALGGHRVKLPLEMVRKVTESVLRPPAPGATMVCTLAMTRMLHNTSKPLPPLKHRHLSAHQKESCQ